MNFDEMMKKYITILKHIGLHSYQMFIKSIPMMKGERRSGRPRLTTQMMNFSFDEYFDERTVVHLMQQTEQLQTDIAQLQDRKETAQEELRQAKKEVQTEKLKGAATTAATNIAESVGSLFGGNKVKTLERENSALHHTVATHEETIETLQAKIQTMQADHSRQMLDMQQKHINESAQAETNFKREISRLTALLNKTLKWFPQIKDMINIERLCLAVGFNKEQTATLLTGKPIEYNGELYSMEHKQKFMAKDVQAKVFSDGGKFILTIDLRPIGEWFMEQFEKLSRSIKPQTKGKGMKL